MTQRSLEVIGNSDTRQAIYHFLLVGCRVVAMSLFYTICKIALSNLMQLKHDKNLC